MNIGIKITHSIIKLVPRKLLCYGVYFGLKIGNYRKQVIINNFKSTNVASFKRFQPSEFYNSTLQNIARIIVETLQLNKDQARKTIFHGVKELEEKCIKENGLLLMAGHYGNWEIICSALPLSTTLPCYGVYMPLKNKRLDLYLRKLRSQFGLQLVPMNGIARSIANNHTEGIPAIYILIADQNPRSIKSVVWTDFLGLKTAFSNGLKKLHEKYQLPYAYMRVTPKNKMYAYNVHFDYPAIQEPDPTLWYSRMLEAQIRDQPRFWLWSHKRWKRKFTGEVAD